MAIQGGRIQKANKKSQKTKGKGKGKGKGKDKSYISKPKNPKPSAKQYLVKNDAYHHCKEVGHCKMNCSAYLAELIKKKKQVGTASSSDFLLSFRQDLGFIPSGNVVLSSTYVGKILGADQLLVILCYRYQESGIGYWILSMTISGSGVTFLPSEHNEVRQSG
ncbi:hypothetical protein Tco_1241627 [Tanacetum coccineum]